MLDFYFLETLKSVLGSSIIHYLCDGQTDRWTDGKSDI